MTFYFYYIVSIILDNVTFWILPEINLPFFRDYHVYYWSPICGIHHIKKYCRGWSQQWLWGGAADVTTLPLERHPDNITLLEGRQSMKLGINKWKRGYSKEMPNRGKNQWGLSEEKKKNKNKTLCTWSWKSEFSRKRSAQMISCDIFQFHISNIF